MANEKQIVLVFFVCATFFQTDYSPLTVFVFLCKYQFDMIHVVTFFVGVWLICALKLHLEISTTRLYPVGL